MKKYKIVMTNNINLLLENKFTFNEAIKIFKKERNRLYSENKVEEIKNLEVEMIPIYEKALKNSYELLTIMELITKYKLKIKQI